MWRIHCLGTSYTISAEHLPRDFAELTYRVTSVDSNGLSKNMLRYLPCPGTSEAGHGYRARSYQLNGADP